MGSRGPFKGKRSWHGNLTGELSKSTWNLGYRSSEKERRLKKTCPAEEEQIIPEFVKQVVRGGASFWKGGKNNILAALREKRGRSIQPGGKGQAWMAGIFTAISIWGSGFLRVKADYERKKRKW